MNPTAQILLTLGGVFLLGMATDLLGRRTSLPRITLLMLFGMLIGQEVLDIIPAAVNDRFPLIANMALLMVGFLLGGRLTLKSLKQSSAQTMWISISAVLATAFLITLGLWLIGVPLAIALILGCIASATDPAAIIDIIMESKYEGNFTNLLVSIVAVDDAWALILFSIGLAIVSALNGMEHETSHIMHVSWDIGGAMVLGILIGLPAAFLTGRLKPGQPILSEALGLVFVCGGLAIWLDVSFLIASMTMGAIVTNLAKHHSYPFHAIENIEWPIMSLFFVLAGASLEFSSLKVLGLIGLAYIALRSAGKIIGAYVGGLFSHTDKITQRWMGTALLPQGGAAMGMALVAANKFPEYGQSLLTIVIGATIIFEIFGPVFAQLAMRHSQSASD